MIEVEGKVKNELMRTEGDLRIKTLEAEGKINLEKRRIDNERLKDQENHKKEMEQMEKDHELNKKK